MDSIPKYVQLRGGNVMVHAGKTVSDLNNKIVFGDIPIEKFDMLLVHAGINDLNDLLDTESNKLVNKTLPMDIIRKYYALRNSIRRRNQRCILLFSSILHRGPKSFKKFFPYVYGVNFGIEKMCAKSGGTCVFVPSWQAFVVKNGLSYSPKSELFASDSLHLNGAGVDVLSQVLQQAMTGQFVLEKLGSVRRRRLEAL